MKFFPELEEVKKIAADGKYRVLPVSCEMLSDFTTPIETMKILKNVSTHCYMLESAMANDKWGRYTFMGYEPKMEITCRDGEMKAGSFSVKTIKAQDLTIFRHLPVVWWDIFPMTIWDTANRQCGARWKIRKISKMWT